jgi:multiple sugar transport system ATP-binding protein
VSPVGTRTATATVVEGLGDRTLVHAKLSEGLEVIAQDSGTSKVQAGDGIGLAFDTTEFQAFDGQGRAVTA